jgi:hypothetical protein
MHAIGHALDDSLRARARALKQLSRHRQEVMDLFTAWRGAASRRRGLLQRRLLLGLGLQWKAEEEFVLPRLLEARPNLSRLVQSVRDELGVLRDLSMLAGRTAAADRQMVMGMLEGLSQLHSANVEELGVREGQGGSDMDWLEVDAAVEDLLSPWGHIAAMRDAPVDKDEEDTDDGDNTDAEDDRTPDTDEEDEDADPVGQPPR